MSEDVKKKILLIEDDEDIRPLYVSVLEDAGYVVFEAAEGTSGMAKVLEGNWDLLLLDIVLPNMDGVQVLTGLKEKDELKDKPVVLLTNLGNESVINRCFELGADGYLIKSQITPDKVVAEVDVYLSNK